MSNGDIFHSTRGQAAKTRQKFCKEKNLKAK